MRFLLVTEFLPAPLDRHGAGGRTRQLLDGFAELGEVDLFVAGPHALRESLEKSGGRIDRVAKIFDHSEEQPDSSGGRRAERYRRALRIAVGRGASRSGFRIDRRLATELRGVVSEGGYDAVVVRYVHTAFRTGAHLLKDVPLIVDADDHIVSVAESRLEAHPVGSPVSRLRHRWRRRQLAGLKRLFDVVRRRADHMWMASERDTRDVASSHVTTLPNVPLDDRQAAITPCGPLPDDAAPVLMFVGSNAVPNLDALAWFFDGVWARVRAERPDARFRIVGKYYSSPAVNSWRSLEGVEFVGFVDDLKAEYDAATVVAAPLTWGGGTKLKVLEALAYGRPFVGTSAAIECMPDPATLCAFAPAADDPGAFADDCLRVLGDAAERRRRVDEGLAYYAKHFSIASLRDEIARRVVSVSGRDCHAEGPETKE